MRTDISHCLQLPCAQGVYLSLHNRACVHLGRDVRTWLSREWSLARNHLEMHLRRSGFRCLTLQTSKTSDCDHFTSKRKSEPLLQNGVCRNPVTTEGLKVWGEKRTGKPRLGSGQSRTVIGSLHNVFVFHQTIQIRSY